jgi:anti-sigma factor RsiW
MNCLQCQQLLQDRLDGLPPSDAAGMNRHLAACARCRGEQAAARRLEEGLRLLTPPAPRPGLSGQIVAAVRRDQVRRRRRQRFVRAGLAVAAVLLLVLTMADHRRVPVPVPPRPEQPVAHQPQGPSLRESVAEASTAVVDLAGRTADQTVGQSRLLLPVVMASPLETPADPLAPMETPMRSLREAGQGVSSGLEPVADSARRAFDMVLREIPTVGPGGKPGY